MRFAPALLFALLLAPVAAFAKDWPHDGIRTEVFSAAEKAVRAHAGDIANPNVMAIVDYGLPSDKPRLFLLDKSSGKVTAYLVAHGQGSDPDFDGIPTEFSNTENSHASSLGAFLTGGTYEGKHGLSLKLEGLDATNNNAEARAIVVHGASYVEPGRQVLGRSWGCPAVENRFAPEIIEKLAGGAFLYIAR